MTTKKNLIATLVIFISFLFVFGNEIIIFDYKSAFEDSYNRLRTLNHVHLVYSNKEEDKIHFIKNFREPNPIWPRNANGNQFGFHPYWSLNKGRYIYDNNNSSIYRLTNKIEEYLLGNQIDLVKECSYKSDDSSNIKFINIKNEDKNESFITYRILDALIKVETNNQYAYLKIFDDQKKLVSEIIINKNDNFNYTTKVGGYLPMIKNYSFDDITFDSFKTSENFLRVSILTKKQQNFYFDILEYNNEDLLKNFADYKNFDELLAEVSLLQYKNKSLNNIFFNDVYTNTIKCSPKKL